ncbi:uncharacterized protein LOC144548851 [Carex rostrata]
MAFWAPFLLLHFGGPDTITSYSIEDNELWWKHFLGLVVQVVVSFMVLLELVAIPRLRVAAALVFIAGLVKYIERTLALRSSSVDQLKEHIQGRYARQNTMDIVEAITVAMDIVEAITKLPMETLIRRPLQPKNLNSIPSLENPPKKLKKLNQKTTTQPLIQDNTSKENHLIQPSVCKENLKKEKQDDELMREASLAEELEIVRKRRERLRLEREKTEEMLRERDLVLERAMKKMERRGEEQNSIELEIYKFILLKDLRTSSMRVYPVQSLRMKEEEKKSRELSEGVYSVKTLRQKEVKKSRGTQSKTRQQSYFKKERKMHACEKLSVHGKKGYNNIISSSKEHI